MQFELTHFTTRADAWLAVIIGQHFVDASTRSRIMIFLLLKLKAKYLFRRFVLPP
jgi:hypothetical protein